jgi:hypothetical protein
MRPFALTIVSLIAVVLGLWHGQLAMQAIFVFREGEPIASWLAIFLGPATTLIASVLAIFMRKPGGIWLIAGGLVSFLVFLIGEGTFNEYVMPFLFRISLPMIGVGLAFLWCQRVSLRTPQSSA